HELNPEIRGYVHEHGQAVVEGVGGDQVRAAVAVEVRQQHRGRAALGRHGGRRAESTVAVAQQEDGPLGKGVDVRNGQVEAPVAVEVAEGNTHGPVGAGADAKARGRPEGSAVGPGQAQTHHEVVTAVVHRDDVGEAVAVQVAHGNAVGLRPHGVAQRAPE